MHCPNCGTANADGAAFCSDCGTALPADGGAVATADAGHGHGGVPQAVMEPGGDALLEQVKKELGGDYSIEKELGRGGMAVVYKGVEKALERVVAIKVVPPESANAGQAAERFRREARLAASLDHANIIPVYRVGQAGPLHYMAMKFVEGRAVDSIIDSQGALPLNVAIAILRYSAAGLAFAHEKKIVHRDIKGANILVDKDGRVMVSDFGIARALEEVSLTASGMVIGTPYYMSPEQCGGQKISPQSDQYSLGIMGFQMLTGEVPFNAESMVGVIQHHYMTPVPDIRAVRQDVPQELLDIIYCSLNKAPEDRFTTTREMAQALENIPQTETDREEAEKLLKELSSGKAIPKVRTGTLPPLTLTISGPAAPVVPRPVSAPRKIVTQPGQRTGKRKKKKKNKALVPMAMLGLGIVGAGGFWYSQQAGVSTKAHVVFTGLPTDANAQVTSGGLVYQSGDSAGAGRLVFAATADGYDPASKTVLLTAGKTDTIAFDMKLTEVASGPPAGAANQPTGAAPPPVASPSAPAATQQKAVETTQVNINASPLTAEIYIDDKLVGSGRGRFTVTVAQHKLTFRTPNCTEDENYVAKVGPIETVTHAMKCG